MFVQDVPAITEKFTQRYGFNIVGRRDTSSGPQWVLQSGLSRFLISQRSNNPAIQPTTFSSASYSSVDSVVNVALEVDSVEDLTSRLANGGNSVLTPPTTVRDNDGEVRYSVVKSPVGDVVHTLLNKTNYPEATFLPGFTRHHGGDDVTGQLTSHMDHFVYVCRPGESQHVAKWYQQYFGMQRLYTSR